MNEVSHAFDSNAERFHRQDAVSYTHLDVYKRQNLSLPYHHAHRLLSRQTWRYQQRTNHFGRDFLQMGAFSPVSYTHLDVYKRQNQRFGHELPAGAIYVDALFTQPGRRPQTVGDHSDVLLRCV